jgi:hypothetical protein
MKTKGPPKRHPVEQFVPILNPLRPKPSNSGNKRQLPVGPAVSTMISANLVPRPRIRIDAMPVIKAAPLPWVGIRRELLKPVEDAALVQIQPAALVRSRPAAKLCSMAATSSTHEPALGNESCERSRWCLVR